MSTSICVVGAGVVGLTCALTLAHAGHQVTILARELPGDQGLEWCSPWAGAVFLPMRTDPGEDRRSMIAYSFGRFRDLALQDTTCGVQLLTLTSYLDDSVHDKDLWYRTILPDYRVLGPSEHPPDATFGFTCKSVTINPELYLPWLLDQVHRQGVIVRRCVVNSLANAKQITGATIILNATGIGAAQLVSGEHGTNVPVRGQTLFVPTRNFNRVVIREGREYTYVIPRMGSGGAILGGVRQEGNTDSNPDQDLRNDIIRRVNLLTSGAFQHAQEQREVTKDIVGFRPGRRGGPRIERDGCLVHAYGFDGEGYVYSWGVAEKVQALVLEVSGPYARL